MSAFTIATEFFHNCETLKGWEECRKYVADGARFSAQCEPLAEFTTVKGIRPLDDVIWDHDGGGMQL